MKDVAGMNQRVIEDDQTEFPGTGGLGGKGVQCGDDGGGSDAAGDGLKVALVRGAKELQGIQARAGGAEKGQVHSARLPGIRNGQREHKTVLVEIKHFDHPSCVALPELAQARVRGLEGCVIARARTAVGAVSGDRLF